MATGSDVLLEHLLFQVALADNNGMSFLPLAFSRWLAGFLGCSLAAVGSLFFSGDEMNYSSLCTSGIYLDFNAM